MIQALPFKCKMLLGCTLMLSLLFSCGKKEKDNDVVIDYSSSLFSIENHDEEFFAEQPPRAKYTNQTNMFSTLRLNSKKKSMVLNVPLSDYDFSKEESVRFSFLKEQKEYWNCRVSVYLDVESVSAEYNDTYRSNYMIHGKFDSSQIDVNCMTTLNEQEYKHQGKFNRNQVVEIPSNYYWESKELEKLLERKIPKNLTGGYYIPLIELNEKVIIFPSLNCIINNQCDGHKLKFYTSLNY